MSKYDVNYKMSELKCVFRETKEKKKNKIIKYNNTQYNIITCNIQ